jgi:hypothetical protein
LGVSSVYVDTCYLLIECIQQLAIPAGEGGLGGLWTIAARSQDKGDDGKNND